MACAIPRLWVEWKCSDEGFFAMARLLSGTYHEPNGWKRLWSDWVILLPAFSTVLISATCGLSLVT